MDNIINSLMKENECNIKSFIEKNSEYLKKTLTELMKKEKKCRRCDQMFLTSLNTSLCCDCKKAHIKLKRKEYNKIAYQKKKQR